MNAFRTIPSVRLVLASTALALLAGCASSGSSLAAKGGHSGIRNDADYVYAVEHQAKRRGVKVVWVNPPTEQGRDYVSNVE
jgi:uncharacterized protein YceK